MDITELKHDDGSHSIKITRSLDRTNVNDLDEALGLIWNKSETPVWLDIGELQSIDSAGLTLFLTWHRKSLNEGRRFALVQPTAFHLKLLEITRLDEELVILAEPAGPRIRRAPSGPYPQLAPEEAIAAVGETACAELLRAVAPDEGSS